MGYEFSQLDKAESLPDQIRSYLSQYVKNRMDDFAQIKKIDFDFIFIRDYCHKVVGSARSYHLHQLEEITLDLQKYAREENKEAIISLLKDYEIYLNDLAQKYIEN